MITPELQTYIQQQLGAGVAKEFIKQNLASKGWDMKDVNDVFIAIESTQSAPAAAPVSQPASASGSHKGRWILIIVTLLLLGAGGAYAYLSGMFTSPAEEPFTIPLPSQTTTTESSLPIVTSEENATSTVSTTTADAIGTASTTTPTAATTTATTTKK